MGVDGYWGLGFGNTHTHGELQLKRRPRLPPLPSLQDTRPPQTLHLSWANAGICIASQANFFVGQVEDNSGTEWLEPQETLPAGPESICFDSGCGVVAVGI